MTTRAATAEVNYMAASVAPSLYRNGALLTRRDADGNDAGTEGMDVDKRTVPVLDGRRSDPAPTLAANGFELYADPVDALALDFLDHEAVVDRYYAACETLVGTATGAAVVHAFDHNVRSVSGSTERARLKGGQEVQPPIHIVHGDYTLRSSRERLAQLARTPSRNDTYVRRLAPGASLVDPELAAAADAGDVRFGIVNVWRNISAEPVVTRPLALCDGRSVDPSDLVVFEIHYADRIGENYFARHRDDHRWFTFPGVERGEALLIKQWDSAGALARSDGARRDDAGDGPCTFSFHTAFRDPATPEGAPDRWSIEVRCLVLYA